MKKPLLLISFLTLFLFASAKISASGTPKAMFSSPTNVCQGDSAHFINSSTNATSYAWFLNSVKFDTTLNASYLFGSTGTFTVSLVAYNGPLSDTAKVVITVLSVPNPTIIGNHTVCPGTNTVMTASGATSYIWNTGQTTSSITVDPTVTTIYTVTASNGKCSDTASFKINVLPLPTITLTGPTTSCTGDTITLSATGGGSYQWSTGATTSSITVISTPSDSIFWVVVDKGCSDTGYAIVKDTCVAGINTISPQPKISISPNPNNGIFNISTGNSDINGKIEICNVLGERIYQSVLNTMKTRIYLININAGIYILKIFDEKGANIIVSKVIIE